MDQKNKSGLSVAVLFVLPPPRPPGVGSWLASAAFACWPAAKEALSLSAMLMLQLRFDGSFRAGGAGGAEQNAIRKSRGRRTTKIHARVDALGHLLAYVVTGGQVRDSQQALSLLKGARSGALAPSPRPSTQRVSARRVCSKSSRSCRCSRTTHGFARATVSSASSSAKKDEGGFRGVVDMPIHGADSMTT